MLPDTGSDAASGASLPAWLSLLTLVVLSWPRPNPIAGDFATSELTAAGATGLLICPLVLWLLFRRPLPIRGFLWLFVALLLPSQFGTVTDTLELDRAVLTFLVAVLAATGAAAFSERGREIFLRGLVVSSSLLLTSALVEGAPGWGGVLGNSGELSAAALPGAIVGAVLCFRCAGLWRWLGALGAAMFLIHAFFAPVVASLLVVAVVAFAAAILGRNAGSTWRGSVVILGLVALAALAWLRLEPRSVEPAPATIESSSPTVAPETQFGGFEVRRRVWRASLELFLNHPLTGAGLGQFAVVFPEVRDPQERALSNWNGEIEQTTEVEHPHSDWLLPWLEGGLVAGLAWWIFLIGIFARARTFLRERDASSLAIGAGSAALVLAASVNAPLLYNPVASYAAFSLFGMLIGPERRLTPRRGRWSLASFLTPGFALLFLLGLPQTWNLWRHGAALADLSETTSTSARALAVERALEARADSVVARTLEARLLEGRGELEQALESWERVLELRPLRFEAWMQRGVLLARLGRLHEAQAAFDVALGLDPEHAPLLRNRVRCYAEQRRIAEALEEIARIEELGHFSPLWLRDLGCELILRGRVNEARPLLARADGRFSDLTGEKAWALETEYRRGDRTAADAFKALAYFTWARDQAQDEKWQDARRSYFQALRIMRDYGDPGGPTRVRMERAAAMWHSGQRAESREALEGLEARAEDWASLPEWAGEALFMMGFGVERQ
jgi:O-antigen ligase/Tfp pilus assembly protein PilF